MKIRMLTGISGTDFNLAPKEETERFTDGEAVRLMLAEAAEPADDESQAALVEARAELLVVDADSMTIDAISDDGLAVAGEDFALLDVVGDPIGIGEDGAGEGLVAIGGEDGAGEDLVAIGGEDGTGEDLVAIGEDAPLTPAAEPAKGGKSKSAKKA